MYTALIQFSNRIQLDGLMNSKQVRKIHPNGDDMTFRERLKSEYMRYVIPIEYNENRGSHALRVYVTLMEKEACFNHSGKKSIKFRTQSVNYKCDVALVRHRHRHSFSLTHLRSLLPHLCLYESVHARVCVCLHVDL